MVAIPAVLQPSARPSGLRMVASGLPPGWQRGAEVVVRAIHEPERVAPCAVSPADPEHPGDVQRFEPLLIRQGVRCSLLGRPDTGAYATAAANVSGWWALSRELYDGAATGNPSLADATSLGTAGPDVCDAVGVLEDAADTALNGAVAVIHVPVGLAACLGDTVMRADGGMLRTWAGNLVAIHGSGDTLYATGQVWAAVAPIDTNVYDDRRINMSEGWADTAALAVFDPSFIVSVTLGATSPTSP